MHFTETWIRARIQPRMAPKSIFQFTNSLPAKTFTNVTSCVANIPSTDVQSGVKVVCILYRYTLHDTSAYLLLCIQLYTHSWLFCVHRRERQYQRQGYRTADCTQLSFHLICTNLHIKWNEYYLPISNYLRVLPTSFKFSTPSSLGKKFPTQEHENDERKIVKIKWRKLKSYNYYVCMYVCQVCILRLGVRC